MQWASDWPTSLVSGAPFDRKEGDEPALNDAEIAVAIAFLKTLAVGYQPGSAERFGGRGKVAVQPVGFRVKEQTPEQYACAPASCGELNAAFAQ
jgi:hypothetical protein